EDQAAVAVGLVFLRIVGQQLAHRLDQAAAAADLHRARQRRLALCVAAQLLRLRQADLAGDECAGAGVDEGRVKVRISHGSPSLEVVANGACRGAADTSVSTATLPVSKNTGKTHRPSTRIHGRAQWRTLRTPAPTPARTRRRPPSPQPSPQPRRPPTRPPR